MLTQSCQNEPVNKKVRSETFLPEPQFSTLDVQYEICSKFMKMANEQMYTRELELMQASSQFLEKAQDLFSFKDISSTQESMTLLDTFLDDEDVFSQPSKSRLLLRKSTSNSNLKRTESGLNQALREVARKCSEKTSSMLSNLSGEFRKLKQKQAGSEKYEKELKRIQARLASTEEELAISRKRVSDLQKDSQTQSDEARSLKKRLKEANEQTKSSSLILSKSSEQLPQLLSLAPTDKMRRFLEQKQVHVFKKEKEIRLIQDKIQQSLESAMGGGCQKCCQMMKRIKESIMKYRIFLQEEVTVAQQCYQNFKRHFH